MRAVAPRRRLFWAALLVCSEPPAPAGALVPLLLETLTQQEESQFDEEGEWTISQAGATCLRLVAVTVGDDVARNLPPPRSRRRRRERTPSRRR